MAHFNSVEKDTRKAKEGSRSGQTRRFSRKAPKGCLTRPDTRKKRASSIKLMTKQATLDALFLFSIKIKDRISSIEGKFGIKVFTFFKLAIFVKS
jgi:hypothetical protein